jgi:hypothetical protein
MKSLRSAITPGFIPHEDFHKGKWLLPDSNPHWYYYLKKQNSNRITNRSFIESVDGPLKELVQFLQDKGIKTTPSCAGHHFSEKNFEMIYDHLEKDKDKIRNGGLKLTDIETGVGYLFKKENYRLPWTKDQFLRDAITYQQKGIIGMRLGNRKKIKERILDIKMEGVEIHEKSSIIFISVGDKAKGENREIWKKITAEIKNAFADFAR